MRSLTHTHSHTHTHTLPTVGNEKIPQVRSLTHTHSHTHTHTLPTVGNEKIPQVRSVGEVGVYMNQFPFDLTRTTKQAGLHALASYDTVLLNSRYTLGWYETYVTPAAEAMRRQGLPVPKREVCVSACASVCGVGGGELAAARRPTARRGIPTPDDSPLLLLRTPYPIPHTLYPRWCTLLCLC